MSIELSRNQVIGLMVFVLVGLVFVLGNVVLAVGRQEQLDSLEDTNIERMFDDIESQEFGVVVDGVTIQSPSLIVLIESIQEFKLHVVKTGGVIYTTDIEPRYVWRTREYQNKTTVLISTYSKVYYVFNDPMTIAWSYTYEAEFTFTLEDQ